MPNPAEELEIAIKHHEQAAIRTLLAANPELKNCSLPESGLPPVHLAIREGFETFTTVLEVGCDPNALNAEGKTAMLQIKVKNHEL